MFIASINLRNGYWFQTHEHALPFSSSCFFSPTVLGLPLPLRIGSDWLLVRGRLRFSMSPGDVKFIFSFLILSVRLLLASNLSETQ